MILTYQIHYDLWIVCTFSFSPFGGLFLQFLLAPSKQIWIQCLLCGPLHRNFLLTCSDFFCQWSRRRLHIGSSKTTGIALNELMWPRSFLRFKWWYHIRSYLIDFVTVFWKIFAYLWFFEYLCFKNLKRVEFFKAISVLISCLHIFS